MNVLNLNKIADEIYEQQQYLEEFGGYDELDALLEVEDLNEYDCSTYESFFSEGNDEGSIVVDL